MTLGQEPTVTRDPAGNQLLSALSSGFCMLLCLLLMWLHRQLRLPGSFKTSLAALERSCISSSCLLIIGIFKETSQGPLSSSLYPLLQENHPLTHFPTASVGVTGLHYKAYHFIFSTFLYPWSLFFFSQSLFLKIARQELII